MTQDYSVRTLPWLPVQWLDGTTSRIGLDEALAKAHLIAKVDLDEPARHYSVMRFLCTAFALVLRENGVTNAKAAKAILRTGIDPAWVERTFSRGDRDEQLLLTGRVPFLQQPRFAPYFEGVEFLRRERETDPLFWGSDKGSEDDITPPTSLLHDGLPGKTEKTWFSNHHVQHSRELPVADAPVLLITLRLFAGFTNNSRTIDGVSLKSGGGLIGGAVSRAGIRRLWLGDTLAEALLRNTPTQWLASTKLPMWLDNANIEYDAGFHDGYEAAFVSASEVLLGLNETGDAFRHALLAGALRVFLAGKVRNEYAATAVTSQAPFGQLVHRHDPHAIWQHDLVRTSKGEIKPRAYAAGKTPVKKSIKGMVGAGRVVNDFRNLFWEYRTEGNATELVLPSSSRNRFELFSFSVTGGPQSELAGASRRVAQQSDIVALTIPEQTAMVPFAEVLRGAWRSMLKQMEDQFGKKNYQAHCNRIEPLLDSDLRALVSDAVEQVRSTSDAAPTEATLQRIGIVVADAYSEYMTPYITMANIAEIARGCKRIRASVNTIIKKLNPAPKEVSNNANSNNS